jgi:hypothetical protein
MVSLRKKTLILLFLVTAVSGLASARDHSRDYGELRDIVDRTQSDLKAASG